MNPDVAPEFLAKSFPTTSASAALPAGEVKIHGTAIPRFQFVTPSPTATMSPESSCPIIRGVEPPKRPERMFNSVRPTPADRTFITASPGPASGSATSRKADTSPQRGTTIARMEFLVCCPSQHIRLQIECRHRRLQNYLETGGRQEQRWPRNAEADDGHSQLRVKLDRIGRGDTAIHVRSTPNTDQ